MNPPAKSTLSPAERHDRDGYEKVIEMGLQSFVEVGHALMQIADRRLYRETHGSFEPYCREKWSMSARRAYQLCEAAKVVLTLPAPKTVNNCSQITNEAQARELSQVPVENRAEVLAAAGPEPTAKAIRKAAAPFVPAKKSPQGGMVPAGNLSPAPAGSTPAPATTFPTAQDALPGNPKFFYARQIDEAVSVIIDAASDDQIDATILAMEIALKKLREEKHSRSQTNQP